MRFGIDRLLEETELRKPLAGRRVALLAHPASVTRNLDHSLDALAAVGDVRLSAAFGPQHGLRGDKQDNMVESRDYTDPVHGIPVFSLYGEVRRPTPEMMDTFDVLLVDLQDVGCRIYTFVTTLRYVLEAAAKKHKAVWVLDRPNPVGRPVEGLMFRPGCESFVGAGAMPMRHGLTLGELARWFVRDSASRRRLPRRADGGLGAERRTRIWVAARRAHVGQPKSQRSQSVDGALLSGFGDARGDDVVGRAWNHKAAGNARCAGSGRAGVAGGNAFAGGAMDERLSAAALLVRAHVS